MATNIWYGGADPVAKVLSFEFTSPTGTGNSDMSLAVGSMIVSDTVASGDDIASEFKTKWDNSQIPAVYGITASVSDNKLYLTGKADGTDFDVTISCEAVESAAINKTVSQTLQSPNDWDTDANWSLGAKPTASDDVVFDRGAVPVLYGLEQDVTVQSFSVKPSYRGAIGLPKINQNVTLDGKAIPEYRNRYLNIKSSKWDIDGSNCQYIYVDVGSSATNVNIIGGNVAVDGGNGSNKMYLKNGRIVFGVDSGDFEGIYMTQGGSPSVFVDKNGELDNLDQIGGSVTSYGNITRWSNKGGVAQCKDGVVGKIGLKSKASLTYDSPSGLGGLYVSDSVADFTGSDVSKSVSNIHIWGGSTIRDRGAIAPVGTVTLENCDLTDINLDLKSLNGWSFTSVEFDA